MTDFLINLDTFLSLQHMIVYNFDSIWSKLSLSFNHKDYQHQVWSHKTKTLSLLVFLRFLINSFSNLVIKTLREGAFTALFMFLYESNRFKFNLFSKRWKLLIVQIFFSSFIFIWLISKY